MIEVGAYELPAGEPWPGVIDVLTASGVVASRSAARRAITEGGAYLTTRGSPTPTLG